MVEGKLTNILIRVTSKYFHNLALINYNAVIAQLISYIVATQNVKVNIFVSFK